MEVIKQLCIRSWEVKAENGDRARAEQGKTYTTSVPQKGKKA